MQAKADDANAAGSKEVRKEEDPLPSLRAAVRHALAPTATDDAANAVLQQINAAGPKASTKAIKGEILFLRALVRWRWKFYFRALQDLKDAAACKAEGARIVLLSLRMCLGQWQEAHSLAKALKQEDALRVMSTWIENLEAMPDLFFPRPAKFVPVEVDALPGISQRDARIPVGDGVELGVRLLLRTHEDDTPDVKRPLILYFHGNAETVDDYIRPEVFEPFVLSKVSILVVDFRGYGFSTGSSEPTLANIHVDGEKLCDALPGFMERLELPWPWPGRFFLFGRSMGSFVASHLAAVRPTLFDGGVVLESAVSGSHAPGAPPPPMLEADGGMNSSKSEQSRLDHEERQALAAEFGRFCQDMVANALPSWTGLAPSWSFIHLLGNSDKLRGFGERLLILHGKMDTLVIPGHASQLCDAAEFAERKLVFVLGATHNNLSFKEDYRTALATFLK